MFAECYHHHTVARLLAVVLFFFFFIHNHMLIISKPFSLALTALVYFKRNQTSGECLQLTIPQALQRQRAPN